MGSEETRGDEVDRRCRLNYGIFNSTEHSKELKTDIKVTAAAILDAFHAEIKSVSRQNGMDRLVMDSGDLLLNSDNGTPREFNVKNDRIRIELRSGGGLLAKELARVKSETKDWLNQNQPGHEWTNLASMVLEDVSLVQAGDELRLCLNLFNNEAAVARFNRGLGAMDERRNMFIPPDRPTATNTGLGPHPWYERSGRAFCESRNG